MCDSYVRFIRAINLFNTPFVGSVLSLYYTIERRFDGLSNANQELAAGLYYDILILIRSEINEAEFCAWESKHVG